VFCSFLALVFKKALEDRIVALARCGSWPQIIADLDSLTETEIEHDSKRSSATRHVRPPASPCVRLASHCRRPCVRPRSADPTRSENVDCNCRLLIDYLISKLHCGRWVRDAAAVEICCSVIGLMACAGEG
jgi:hypothetical protein